MIIPSHICAAREQCKGIIRYNVSEGIIMFSRHYRFTIHIHITPYQVHLTYTSLQNMYNINVTPEQVH